MGAIICIVEYLLKESMRAATLLVQDQTVLHCVVTELTELPACLSAQLTALSSQGTAAYLLGRYISDLQFIREAFKDSTEICDLIIHCSEFVSNRYAKLSVVSPDQRDEKITSNLSVASMGVLLNLFAENGVVTADSKKDLIRFFSRHVKTAHQQTISSESLYGRYFKMNTHSLREIKNLLLKMINDINKKLRE